MKTKQRNRLEPACQQAGTAAALVISSMIGTGVFTSLGFQLIDIEYT